MPFSGNRPNGLAPLKLNKKTIDYKELYDNNHQLFCQRFIDTVLSYHMDTFMSKMVEYNISLPLLEWGIWDTDMLLWKLRDCLDTFLEGYYVMNTIRCEFIELAIDDFFRDLENKNINLKTMVE